MQSLAIVFPGQGAQSVGMLADIANNYPEVKATYHEAGNVLGYDLWKLVSEGPADLLDQTMHTQPAILTGSYAIWKILSQKKSLKPAIFAGHSLGEYSALVCADALSFVDAVKLVAIRGQYMQEAVPLGQGALGVILGLEDEKVSAICHEAVLPQEVLSPANYNSPGQTVIAGHKESVNRALSLAKESGAKIAKLLPVSVPAHCDLMKPAALKFKTILAHTEFRLPKIAILNNVDVKIYSSVEEIRESLYRQLFMPVRWVETIKMFKQKGITHIIECGPSKVLTGLNKRIEPDISLMQTSDINSLKGAISC